eukprot:TRINITY_DN8118_c0_g1_i1.p1 TRINITY_DN8118_c0_g1~~TRINITY_DN8118_c0_g1_i1.p1  ORF type:complete len:358 (+),score=44.15 TRINITY_DN8118_c0_g1_i1:128-1201(+)
MATDASTAPEPAPRVKLGGYEFYNSLGAPKLMMAPMVDQSELAFRVLCRRYGTQLCYSPMIHSRLFVEDPKYRAEIFSTMPEDRPLIVQFCANNPDTLLAAAKLVEHCCDAVDINLGCPQHIAKRGHYGAFLMEEPDLICSMVDILHKNLAVPVTCKIRRFATLPETLAYARRIEAAGCQMLGVHGRTRDMKGQLTGLADWNVIKAVKDALRIPVISNGNVRTYEDAMECLRFTGCDGVMSAEGLLANPRLFGNVPADMLGSATEYLQICRTVENGLSSIRAHMFRILKPILPLNTDVREILATANSLQRIEEAVAMLVERAQKAEELVEPAAKVAKTFPEVVVASEGPAGAAPADV